MKKNGGCRGKIYNHPDSSIADCKSIGIHSSEALNVEQIQPGFELIFKGVKYRFGKPLNDRWNRFQAEWEGVMEKRREFLATCARNNAVRPNVNRRVVSTPNGIESVPSAAAQSSPQQSPFNFEYDERSYATVKTAQPASVKLRPSSVSRARKATHAHIDVHSVSIPENDAVSVASSFVDSFSGGGYDTIGSRSSNSSSRKSSSSSGGGAPGGGSDPSGDGSSGGSSNGDLRSSATSSTTSSSSFTAVVLVNTKHPMANYTGARGNPLPALNALTDDAPDPDFWGSILRSGASSEIQVPRGVLYPKNERRADNPAHAKMRQACIKLCSGEDGPLLKRGRKLGIPASLSDIMRLEKGDSRKLQPLNSYAMQLILRGS